MTRQVPFVRPHRSGRLNEILSDALREEWLSAGGKYARLCEERLENTLGCQKAIITPNGFTALFLSMLLLDAGPGDEILLPAYSCPAALNSVLLCRAEPVLCGINDQGMVTADTLRMGLSVRTKAVVVNHYGGYACDMERILDLCREENLFLIEDCATAFGTLYRGRPVGTFGDMAVFSFNDKKDLCTGEGGALILKRPGLRESAAYRTRNGISRSPDTGPVWVGAGFSNKVSELLCAAVYAELLDAEDIINRKRSICRKYREKLSPLAQSGFFSFPPETDQTPNGNTFYLLFDTERTRNGLMRFLRSRSIETLPHYGTLAHAPARDARVRFAGGESGREFDGRMLRLPVYTSLTDEDTDYVCDEITSYFIGGDKLHG